MRSRRPALSITRYVAVAAICSLLAACGDPRAAAGDIARRAGLVPLDIATATYRLRAWRRPVKAPVLRVYIEGDGHAWRTEHQPSDDPTPWSPVALELAARDPAPAVAYLARPCQYVIDDPACSVAAWTSARYGPAVLAAMNQALDVLRHDAGATRLELVGFSGGGAMAALLAEHRDDIADLRTVAANLDTAAWTALHRLTPLTGSLNPADQARRLAHLPQRHYVGAEDTNVDPSIVRAFLHRIGPTSCVQVVVVPGLGHQGDWAARWRGLVAVAPTCGRGAAS